MIKLIKSSPDQPLDGIRRFEPTRPSPSETPEQAEIRDLNQRLAAGSAEIERLAAEITQLKSAALGSWRDGHTAGVLEGERQAGDRAQEKLALLTSAVDTAHHALERQLDLLQTQAGALAAECLSRVIGDPANRAELVSRTLHAQVAALQADMIVTIEISAEDFSEEAIQGLADRVDIAIIQIQRSITLPSGGCSIRMTLGEIDLNLDGQVDRLRHLLSSATIPAEPRQ